MDLPQLVKKIKEENAKNGELLDMMVGCLKGSIQEKELTGYDLGIIISYYAHSSFLSGLLTAHYELTHDQNTLESKQILDGTILRLSDDLTKHLRGYKRIAKKE